MITFDDFKKIELKVGEIKEVEKMISENESDEELKNISLEEKNELIFSCNSFNFVKLVFTPMLVYLEKFNKLPAAVRNKVSDSRAMAIIEKLEKKYNVSLAALIMKVMVKEIALDDLTDHLLKENLFPFISL